MVIFNSYVKLPEGIYYICVSISIAWDESDDDHSLWIPWYDHTYAVHMLESTFDLCISIVDQPILSSTGFPSNKQLVLCGNGIHNLKWLDWLGGTIAKVATFRCTQASVPYAYDIWFYNGETWWNCMDIYVGGSILSVVGNRTVNEM